VHFEKIEFDLGATLTVVETGTLPVAIVTQLLTLPEHIHGDVCSKYPRFIVAQSIIP